jgi:hypothetical protein
MRAVLIACVTVATATANAEPSWNIDLAARGNGSFELSNGAPRDRVGLVPNLVIRAERRIGPLFVGGTIGVGFPAWYGEHEAELSIDVEHVISEPRCMLAHDGNRLGSETCRGLGISISAGADAGIGLYYYDAPPMMEAPTDALMYWGALARARVQLHVLNVHSFGRPLGLVIGAGAAVSSARYLSTPTPGTGVRCEPSVEIGLEVRL